MEAEDVINLFDSRWFYQEIFKKSSGKPTSSILKRIPGHQIQENSPEPKISSQLTIHTRSNSEQMMSPKSSLYSAGSFSPNSVLPAPHLESILSGMEGEPEFPRTPETRIVKIAEKKKRRKKKLMKGLSKSLSELEFEELKGFMDLGFVFSEEDKRDSTLVEIIPGLQRLGEEKNGGEEKSSGPDEEEPSITITRPYLSEAWEGLDRRKKMNPLMNWKFPSVSNETGMKDNLKWWAHTVASTVR